jgi:pectinesterase
VSRDFRRWKLLANGPIRVMFELGYEPWDAGGVKVSEVKRISLDAGTHFDRMQSIFTFDGADTLTVGVGLNEHRDFHVLSSISDGWMGVWDQADRPKGLTNGMNGVGVVFPNGVKFEFKEAAKQVWFLTDVKSGQPLNYYGGAGWSKGGFPEMKDWETYVADFAKRAHSPLKVQIEP